MILKAFYSVGLWHIRDVEHPSTWPYFTAKEESEVFAMMREKGFHLVAANERVYFFEGTQLVEPK
jgi:hypothetical protein